MWGIFILKSLIFGIVGFGVFMICDKVVFNIILLVKLIWFFFKKKVIFLLVVCIEGRIGKSGFL